jgi:hypothetical protein
MSKRAPRLQFTDEELAAPEISKVAKKAAKRIEKLEQAEAKIPMKNGAEKPRPASKLQHAIRDAPGKAVRSMVHREVAQHEDENVGVESAHHLEQAVESSVHFIEAAHRSHQLKPYRNADRAEARADSANLDALQKQAQQQNPELQSNPYSRWQQKRAIKKEYAAAKAGGGTVAASEVTAKAAKRAAEDTKKASEWITEHKKGIFLVLGIAAIIVLLLCTASSCSMMIQGSATSINVSTYPSEDSDMLAAEVQYCAMEAELQAKLDNYEATHDYDEYHFDLDEIGHDPYVLISMLTALKGREWTLEEVTGTLRMLFDRQYILTETVETEIRYRTEVRTDRDGNRYTVQVPYEYTICTVALENFDLSHVPVYVMSEDQLAVYAMYMATLGNRPDLFGESDYVNRYYGSGSGGSYDIPPEALEDEAFAAIINEAKKYLGFPYVWGGSSPATSFDCSGFVSYVYNNCGIGWSFGRLSAEGIRQICSYVSPADAKPGDLIFFEKTYNTTGASHIGIYVGNHTMLHCGDPIQYTSISSDYWQSHFLQFGRLAPP